MSEKLIVEGFAGIKKMSLDINKINLFIGPQATGKSVCAKLLFFFKSFDTHMLSSAQNQITKGEMDALFRQRFKEYFPPFCWGQRPFSCCYSINGEYIEINRPLEKKDKIELNYSEFYKDEYSRRRRHLKDLLKEHPGDSSAMSGLRSIRFYEKSLSNVSSHLGEVAGFEQIFIPAGRSFFAYFQDTLLRATSVNSEIDPFLANFGVVYTAMKKNAHNLPKHFGAKGIDFSDIDQLISKILCGRHVIVKKKDYLIPPDGRRVGIANASSGQQETLPLTTLLKEIILPPIFGSGRTVYIEEPEAHIFPTSQKQIVELIAAVFTQTKGPLQFIITTHSPYILTSFNNLIHAGTVAKNLDIRDLKKLKKLDKIVPHEQRLDSDLFSSYSLVDGKAKKIKCKETGLLVADVIDDVSGDLDIEFGKLLDLE